MIVFTFPPHEALRPYVAQYHFIQSNEQSGPSFNMVPRNFSVFIFTAPEMVSVENYIGNQAYPFEKGNIYFSGLGSDPAHMHIKRNTTFIVALLYPAYTGMYLKENASTFTNRLHCITDLNHDLHLLNELLWVSFTSIATQIALIETYLCSLIRAYSRHFYILRAMQAIHSCQGRINVKVLAEKTFTCERNLQRLFQQHVGVSPNQYISMVRFNSFMKEYITTPDTHIETLSEKYQYYDLSHLNKTFIRYLGLAPSFSITEDQTVNKLIV